MTETLDDILSEFSVDIRAESQALKELALIRETKTVIAAMKRATGKTFDVDKEISGACADGFFCKSHVILFQ